MSVDDEGRTSAAFSAMPQPFISPHHASIVRKVVTQKNSFNIVTGDSSIPDIKLIRTDTTLDLSQKAEKGMPPLYERGRIYNMDFIISAIPVYGLNVFELRLLLLRSLYVFRIDCGGP